MAGECHAAGLELRTRQLEKLQTLLREVVPANRFYAAKFGAAGVDGALRSLEEFEGLPFTTKAELVADQRAAPPFGSNLTFALRRYTRFHQTSGTSGSPLRWLDTTESWAWMVDRWLEVYRAAGVTGQDRILFAFSFGPFIGFWLAFEAGTRLGALCLPAGGLSSLARLRMILDAEVTVLCCTPTYALHLAQAARGANLDLQRARMKRIVVAGEPGGSIPATRARLEALWPGARVFDHHGMTETGPVSYECPARPGTLHIMSEGFYPEVVDLQTGEAVRPGQTGELILTNFGRVGSPLIRYRTGDLVKCASPAQDAGMDRACVCGGVGLSLDGGILGRLDDMVIVRGVNIYPGAVEQLVRECGGINEYQVQVDRTGPLTELSLRVELVDQRENSEVVVARLQRLLESAFPLRIPIQVVPAGELPRSEMKAKRWVDCPGDRQQS